MNATTIRDRNFLGLRPLSPIRSLPALDNTSTVSALDIQWSFAIRIYDLRYFMQKKKYTVEPTNAKVMLNPK